MPYQSSFPGAILVRDCGDDETGQLEELSLCTAELVSIETNEYCSTVQYFQQTLPVSV